jgi:two-component system, chemotaxis family, sensor kinase CheA
LVVPPGSWPFAGMTKDGDKPIFGKALRPPRRGRPVWVTQSVLVVDDSANTREIEESVLEAYGYSVALAGDGVEALEKAGGTQYDAIVADVEMPRMDGFCFTETLRRNESYRDTPIILVTSRDKEEDKRRGIKVGANAYFVKGAFDQSSLVETIRNLIG